VSILQTSKIIMAERQPRERVDSTGVELRLRQHKPELFNPEPPKDPSARRRYFIQLAKQIPPPESVKFAVLMTCTDFADASGQWKNTDLWQAYVTTMNRDFSMRLQAIFNPLCNQAADYIFGLSPETFQETSPSTLVLEYTEAQETNNELYASLLMINEDDQNKFYSLLDNYKQQTLTLDAVLNECLELLPNYPNGTFALRLQLEDFEFDAQKLDEAVTQFREQSIFASPSKPEQSAYIATISAIARNGAQEQSRAARFPTKPYTQFVVGAAPFTDITLPNPTIMVPVGKHGLEFAERLYATTHILLQQIREQLEDDCKNVDREHDADIKFIAREASLLAMLEGVLSMKDAILHVMEDDWDSGHTASERLERLANEKIISQLAAMVPMGVISPLILAGKHLAGFIEDNGGRLQFSCPVKHTSRDIREETRSEHLRYTRPIISGTQQLDTGTPFTLGMAQAPSGEQAIGCPVSRLSDKFGTGLDELMNAFVHIYKNLEHTPKND
jgi:hypothetical protein